MAQALFEPLHVTSSIPRTSEREVSVRSVAHNRSSGTSSYSCVPSWHGGHCVLWQEVSIVHDIWQSLWLPISNYHGFAILFAHPTYSINKVMVGAISLFLALSLYMYMYMYICVCLCRVCFFAVPTPSGQPGDCVTLGLQAAHAQSKCGVGLIVQLQLETRKGAQLRMQIILIATSSNVHVEALKIFWSFICLTAGLVSNGDPSQAKEDHGRSTSWPSYPSVLSCSGHAHP